MFLFDEFHLPTLALNCLSGDPHLQYCVKMRYIHFGHKIPIDRNISGLTTYSFSVIASVYGRRWLLQFLFQKVTNVR